jgi:hypothetical protein
VKRQQILKFSPAADKFTVSKHAASFDLRGVGLKKKW